MIEWKEKTVGEIIEELKKFDPNSPFIVENHDEGVNLGLVGDIWQDENGTVYVDMA